ncbi:MAG: integrase [Pseudomonadota bacterium]
MSKRTLKEYLNAIYNRYHRVSKGLKHLILDEFCATTGLNRKYVIRRLSKCHFNRLKTVRRRRRTYGEQVISALACVWESAGYPCSARLKALLALWMTWIKKRFLIDSVLEEQLLSISARQIDRRLKDRKAQIRKRIYGRTKPGTLLKHHIPIRTDNWDIKTPGWTEVDTVSHSGNSAEGRFAYTVNQTDILTTWVESRAVFGKGEDVVVDALDEMKQALPFTLKGLDSDNGSEFINWHLWRYCKKNNIQPFRGRPYKKDDNAHIEQKNWTHVRKLMGWDRYDTQDAVDAMNDLYRNELRIFMNLFIPSIKLLRKERIGSKLKRVYEKPKTPFERVMESKMGDPQRVADLKRLRDALNPFDLSQTIENKLERIYRLANTRQCPNDAATEQKKKMPITKVEQKAMQPLSNVFPGLVIYVGDSKQKRR